MTKCNYYTREIFEVTLLPYMLLNLDKYGQKKIIH